MSVLEQNIYSLENIKEADTPPDARLLPLLEIFDKHYPDQNPSLIEDAYIVARHMHSGQVRKSGEEYIIHPLEVAKIIADLGMPQDVIAAGLLHDTVEDTPYPQAQIEKDFTKSIALMVDGVTKIDRLKLGKSEQFVGEKTVLNKVDAQRKAQAETFRKMILAMSKDIRVLVVKICDRLHNARTWKYVPRETQVRKARETLEIYAPLADRLGLTAIKLELEDISFQILEPKIYNELVDLVVSREEERNQYVQNLMQAISVELDKFGITVEMSGRPKHYYSIYRKMVLKKLDFNDIYDLIGVRILTESVRDCYAALGAIHSLYTPIEGRFKDYIAVPKGNMYQSLHTGVFGPEGRPVEFQIRTFEMHNNAEYGIAAHWKYKDKGGSVVANEAGDKLINDQWLEQLVDLGNDLENSDEFLVDLRTDLSLKEVYVFTPLGKVQTLPIGATPVDFAYAVHTDVGRKTTGAKVNGKLVPLSKELQNGDTVEIITSNNPDAHPSKDWMNFVQSNRAKTKIRQFFAKERRDESIELGKELLINYMRKKGAGAAKLLSKENLSNVTVELHYEDIDELYNAIGEHQISTEKVRMRILEIAGIEDPDAQTETHLDKNGIENEESPKTTASNTGKNAKQKNNETVQTSSGVLIQGIDDDWIKIALCCTPVPGDEIAGFITRGHGVSVHSVDCKSLAQNVAQYPERLIDAAWAAISGKTFRVNAEVNALDRKRLLADVTRVLDENGVNIISSSSGLLKNHSVFLKFSFDVSDMRQMNAIFDEVRTLDGVYEARRISG